MEIRALLRVHAFLLLASLVILLGHPPSAAAGPIGTVTFLAADITGLTEGIAITDGTVGSITDGNPNDTASDFTATIDWGDGTTTAGTITGSNGSFNITGTHNYADEGKYSTLLHVTYLGATFTPTGSATVADAPLTLISTTPLISFTPGILLNNLFLASFSDGNPFGPASDFTATIDWGDGTVSAGTISGTASAFSLTGSHTYASGGNFPILVGVLDDGGASLRTETAASNGTSVPEPATFALLGLGLAGLRFAWRRKPV